MVVNIKDYKKKDEPQFLAIIGLNDEFLSWCVTIMRIASYPT